MKFEIGQPVVLNSGAHGVIVEPLNPSFPNCDTYHWVKVNYTYTASLYPTSSIKVASTPVIDMGLAKYGTDVTMVNGLAYGPKGNLLGEHHEGDNSPLPDVYVVPSIHAEAMRQLDEAGREATQLKLDEAMSKLDDAVRLCDKKDNELSAARVIEENMATEISELHAKVEGLIKLVHLQRDKAEIEEDLRRAAKCVQEYNTRITELNVHLDDIE